MSDQHAPAFSAFETIRIELCGLAAPLLLDPKTLIPSELRQLPPMPEVKKRLWYLGQNGGGMGALAMALPTTRTWQWREMLEKDGPWTIRPYDLARICEYLEDPILYYLVGGSWGPCSLNWTPSRARVISRRPCHGHCGAISARSNCSRQSTM